MLHYSPKRACLYLESKYGITRTHRTLAKYRCLGGGPEYCRVSHSEVLYAQEALDEYARRLLGKSFENTAQESSA